MADFVGGEDAKVDIDGLPYAVKRFGIRYQRPRRDVSNTEGKPGDPERTVNTPGFESARPGLRKAEITLEEPSFDVSDNVFGLPLVLPALDYHDVKIYPNGRGDDYHWFPSVQLEEIGHNGTVGEEQPVDLRGGTDGAFYLYGQTKP
jgi:hypothetical protein